MATAQPHTGMRDALPVATIVPATAAVPGKYAMLRSPSGVTPAAESTVSIEISASTSWIIHSL